MHLPLKEILENRLARYSPAQEAAGATTAAMVKPDGTVVKPDGTPVSGDGKTSWRKKLRRNPNAFSVMSSPPTITVSATNSRSAGRQISVVNGSQQMADSVVSLFGGRYYRQSGTTWPNMMYAAADTFQQGSPSTYWTFRSILAMRYTGSGISVPVYGNSVLVWVKVDDKWASLTGTSAGTGGAVNFINIDFGSALDGARVEVLFWGNSIFDGPYVGIADTVLPAECRGPTGTYFSDSFGESTGNEIAGIFGHIPRVLEYLGLDDISMSAVGSTGLTAGPAPRKNYVDRVARDAFGSQVIIVDISINDSNKTDSEVLAQAQLLVSTAQAAGIDADWVFVSSTINRGPGWIAKNQRLANAAIRTWARTQGYLFLDLMESRLPLKRGAQTITLTAAAALGATSLSTNAPLIPGAQYAFPDGAGFQAKTTSAIDNLPGAQASGAVATLVGPTYLSGAGRVGSTTGWGSADAAISTDGTHPTDMGHRLRATAITETLLAEAGAI